MKTQPFTTYDLRSTRREGSRAVDDFSRFTRNGTRNTQLAFTLIEIMITVGLLSFIVLGLMAMFNQTQRAFRTSMTQSDVLEAGRATMDLLSRELVQMAPTEAPDIGLIGGVRYRATNFFVEPVTNRFSSIAPVGAFSDQLLQGLPGMPNNILRTNAIQRLFFTTKLSQNFIGTGYEVLPEDNNGCVGSLYRFSSTNSPRSGIVSLSQDFLTAIPNALSNLAYSLPVANMSRIADGVVHFRIQAYAKNGFLIVTNAARATNAFAVVPNQPYYTNAWNTIACVSPLNRGQTAAYFMSNAVPAYVDVELGILEPQILQTYRSIPVGVVQRQYLSNHVAQVHLFRQRIAIPNVDPTAYP